MQAKEFNRQQSKLKTRKDRFHIKDFAETVSRIQTELQRLKQSKLRNITKQTKTSVTQDSKQSVKNVKQEDQQSRVTFKKFKRYIEWFTDKVVIKEEDGIQKQNRNIKLSDETKIQKADPI